MEQIWLEIYLLVNLLDQLCRFKLAFNFDKNTFETGLINFLFLNRSSRLSLKRSNRLTMQKSVESVQASDLVDPSTAGNQETAEKNENFKIDNNTDNENSDVEIELETIETTRPVNDLDQTPTNHSLKDKESTSAVNSPLKLEDKTENNTVGTSHQVFLFFKIKILSNFIILHSRNAIQLL